MSFYAPTCSLSTLRRKMIARETSATALAEAALARHSVVNGLLNALELCDAVAARAQAGAADDALAKGAPLGLLHGLPIAVKSNIDVRGFPTTGGTPALAQNHPSDDAPVVAALRREGAIIIGKAAMHELAFGATSNNAWTGAVANPVHPGHVPGGSSGGSAAAVAAGIVPAALGSDTGGSVRVPAALCGIAGYRPSTGRWPQAGILPISHSRDTAGPLATCVADLDLIDRAVVDPARAPARAADLRGLRFGRPRAAWEDLDPEIRAQSEAACDLLRGAGAEIVDVDFSAAEIFAQAAGMTIALAEFATDAARYLEGSGITLEAVMAGARSPDVCEVLAAIAGLDAAAMAAYSTFIEHERPQYQAEIAGVFATLSLAALILPTCPAAAPRKGEDATFVLNGAEVPTFMTMVRNAAFGSVFGLPGISIANGTTRAGLPVGLSLDGPADCDEELFSLALAIEAKLR